MTPFGVDFLRRLEGCKLQAYRDVAGVWTIGYGHTGPDVGPGCAAITEARARHLLSVDLLMFEQAVEPINAERLKRGLVVFMDPQLDALTSFAYNIGVAAFRNSNVRAECLNQRRPTDPYVPSWFFTWTLAGGVPSMGLVNRRLAEYKLFRFANYGR